MFSVFRNCKAGDTPSLSLSRQSSATRLRGYQGRSLCRWKPVAGACEIAESLGRNFKHGVFWRGIDKYLQNVSCALWHDAKGLRKREDETECLGEDCRRTAAACYWFLCSRYRLFDSSIMIHYTKEHGLETRQKLSLYVFVQFVHSPGKWKHCIFGIMKMITLLYYA